MSKKRGLSLDEKRKKMLEIFFEKQEFFHLKEIEKIAPKEKGITPMSVKDVLQSLVDDDMVECEKVGSSSYYYSFPSKALNARQQKSQHLKRQLSEILPKNKQLQENITSAKKSRVECDERTKTLAKIQELTEAKNKLNIEIAKYNDCNPDAIEKMMKDADIAKQSANRWTDNLLMLKSWIKNKFPISESELDKQFGIPEDFDYIE